jgi:DUF971 family protein
MLVTMQSLQLEYNLEAMVGDDRVCLDSSSRGIQGHGTHPQVLVMQDTERNVEIEEIRRRGEERCKGSEDRRSGDTEEKKNREAMIFSKFDINSTTT